MKHPDRSDLLAKAKVLGRSELNPQEQNLFARELKANPGLRAAFEEEKGLEDLLTRLPDFPVSTNFTSLVLQRAEMEGRPSSRKRPPIFPWFRFAFARVATGLVAISVLGLTIVHQYHKSQQAEMAENVRSFTGAASVMVSEQALPVQLLQDFDTIQRLPPPARSDLDLELLVALQK
jgi:hypothetical protein